MLMCHLWINLLSLCEVVQISLIFTGCRYVVITHFRIFTFDNSQTVFLVGTSTFVPSLSFRAGAITCVGKLKGSCISSGVFVWVSIEFVYFMHLCQEGRENSVRLFIVLGGTVDASKYRDTWPETERGNVVTKVSQLRGGHIKPTEQPGHPQSPASWLT